MAALKRVERDVAAREARKGRQRNHEGAARRVKHLHGQGSGARGGLRVHALAQPLEEPLRSRQDVLLGHLVVRSRDLEVGDEARAARFATDGEQSLELLRARGSGLAARDPPRVIEARLEKGPRRQNAFRDVDGVLQASYLARMCPSFGGELVLLLSDALALLGEALLRSALGGSEALALLGDALLRSALGGSEALAMLGDALLCSLLGGSDALLSSALGGSEAFAMLGDALLCSLLGGSDALLSSALGGSDALLSTALGGSEALALLGDALLSSALGGSEALAVLGEAILCSLLGGSEALALLGEALLLLSHKPLVGRDLLLKARDDHAGGRT